MKNMFGDEREPQKLEFSWTSNHLFIKKGGKLFGLVSTNGWTGHTMLIDYERDEPVITNLHDTIISFGEMKQIMAEWENHKQSTES